MARETFGLGNQQPSSFYLCGNGEGSTTIPQGSRGQVPSMRPAPHTVGDDIVCTHAETVREVADTAISQHNRQSTTSPVYKVATCNTIRDLDAALFRRGRWDCVFGVDLPNTEEREAIYTIHLNKRKRDPKAFDLTELAQASEGFVGAEIESAVSEALYVAFDAGREVTTEDIATVTRGIIPISKTSKEDITAFQTWLRDRATPVSSSSGTKNVVGEGYLKRQMPGMEQ